MGMKCSFIIPLWNGMGLARGQSRFMDISIIMRIII